MKLQGEISKVMKFPNPTKKSQGPVPMNLIVAMDVAIGRQPDLLHQKLILLLEQHAASIVNAPCCSGCSSSELSLPTPHPLSNGSSLERSGFSSTKPLPFLALTRLLVLVI